MSFDVQSLYPSITNPQAIDTITYWNNKLKLYDNEQIIFIQQLIQLIQSTSYTKYKHIIAKQINGLAIGACNSGDLANLVLLQYENENIKIINECVLFKRFIDDTFTVMYEDNAIDTILKIIQIYPPNIKLTIDKVCLESGALRTVFLDMMVHKCISQNGWYILRTSVYEKPLNLYSYASFNSNHTTASKTGMIRGELIRFIVLSSTEELYNVQKRTFLRRLTQRGYPGWFIRKVKFPSYNDRNNILASMESKKFLRQQAHLGNVELKKDERIHLIKTTETKYDNDGQLKDILIKNVSKVVNLSEDIIIGNYVKRKVKHMIKPSLN